MTTTFPAALDSLSNPAASDARIGHAALHGDVNDAIEAIEEVIGTTASPVLARLGGVAGGQTLVGGTLAGEALTLRSTGHATKGKILFGAWSGYDEANVRLGIGTANPGARIHAFSITEQLRLAYDASNYLSATVSSSGSVTLAPTGGNVTIQGTCTHSLTDATTSAPVTVESLIKNVTGAGVGAAGLGPRLLFGAESSTTPDTTQADITATWTDATHAVRKTRLALSAWDTAAREGLRIEADGSVPRLGFFGATAVVKPTALTTQLTTLTYTAPGTPDYAISDVTQTSPWGFASGDEARTVLSVIKNLQDRVAQLENKLQGLGLLT